jgi:hypothetical protein
LPESLHLNLYDISNIIVLSEVNNGVFVFNDAAQPYVQRAIDPVFSVVLYKCLDDGVDLELLRALDVSIDERVLSTLRGVPHDLVEHCYVLRVEIPILVVEVLHHMVPILTLHPLIHLGQVKYILGGIEKHIFGEGSLFPKVLILPHDFVDLFLLGVCHIDVVLKQVRQRDVIVIVIEKLPFGAFVFSYLDHTMRYLRVEHIVAY